jgi:hypothetical protein
VENDALAEARARGIEALASRARTVADFSTEFLSFVEEDQGIEPDTKRFYKDDWTLLVKTLYRTCMPITIRL